MSFGKTLFTLAVIACVVFGEGDKKEATTDKTPSDVVELNAASYTKFVKENKLAVVEFYAPWCGHCKAFMPEYERTATALKERGVPVARIDGSTETDVSEAEAIQGFPTIKVYVDGESVVYDGPRSKDGIIAFVEKAQQPAYVTITEKKALDEFVAENPNVVLGFIGDVDTDGPEAQDMFVKTAKAMHFSGRTKFVMVSEASLIAADAEGPTFEFRQPDLDQPARFDMEGSEYDAHVPLQQRFSHWIASLSMPALGEINQDTYQGYVDAGHPLVWFVVADKSDAATLEKYAFVRQVAKENIGRLSFVLLDAKEQPRQVANLGLEKDALPGLVATDRLRYALKGELTEASLRAFLKEYLEGKAEPTLKSQDVPTEEDFAASAVKTVVSKSWEEVVLDPSRDVLVKYYAEWCGHCKAMAPNYQKAAEDLVSVTDKLFLAEFNFPENELKADVGVRGFPTIVFYPANAKDKPVTYQGDRSTGSLLKFIQEHKSFDWEMSDEALADIAAYEAELAKKKAEEEAKKADNEAAPEDEEEEDPEVVLQKLEGARKNAAKRAEKKDEDKKDKEEL